MRSRLYAGKSGSGKTTGAVQDLIEQFESRERYATCCFPHAEMGIRFVSELYCRYGDAILDRLVVESVSDMDRVIMREFVKSNNDPDYWTRMQRNDEYGRATVESIIRRRGLTLATLPEEKPGFDYIAPRVISLGQHQDRWYPEWWLPFGLHTKHFIKKELLNHCTDPELVEEFKAFDFLPARDKGVLLEPAERLFSGFFHCPPIKARTTKKPTWDKKKFFEEKAGWYVILGGDVSLDAIRNFICADFQETVFLAKKGMKREGIYFRDESNNFGLLGEFESHAYSTMRAFKLFMWDVVQSADFPTPEIRNNIFQNAEIYAFQQGHYELTDMLARMFLPMLDEYKVHHQETTERQVHLDPTFEERVTKTHSSHGTSESKTFVPVPRFDKKVETRDVYQSGAEQILWLARKLQQQPIGSCMVRPMEGVPYSHSYRKFKSSWTFKTLEQTKFLELMQKMKALPIFETPELIYPQAPTPRQTSFQRRGTRGPRNT